MKNEKIVAVLFWIALVISVLIGAFIGYSIGDFAMSKSSLIGPLDVLKFRVGLPLVGAVLFFAIGIFVIPSIGFFQDKDEKANKVERPIKD